MLHNWIFKNFINISKQTALTREILIRFLYIGVIFSSECSQYVKVLNCHSQSLECFQMDGNIHLGKNFTHLNNVWLHVLTRNSRNLHHHVLEETHLKCMEVEAVPSILLQFYGSGSSWGRVESPIPKATFAKVGHCRSDQNMLLEHLQQFSYSFSKF